MTPGRIDERNAALALLASARTPADVFGTDPAAARHTYRRLARLVHPDVAGVAAATSAFARLTALWSEFSGAPVTITSRRHSYRVGPVLARGDLATIYQATCTAADGVDVLLKIGRDPSVNDLLAGEAASLRQITENGDPRYRPYIPALVETFSYREPGSGVQRTANVLRREPGFVSLAEVRDAYPGGLDARDAAWMWRRLLVAIGYAHGAGVIHGCVIPEHVLIHPAEHGLMLIDWCYAAFGGAAVPAIVDRYAGWYPPEVTSGRSCGPATDIHLATRCMVELIGRRIPDPLARFARGCTLAAGRPSDAWRLLDEFDELLRRMYGPRAFRPFSMPAAMPA